MDEERRIIMSWEGIHCVFMSKIIIYHLYTVKICVSKPIYAVVCVYDSWEPQNFLKHSQTGGFVNIMSHAC
jgi:hypothetical protein